MLAWGYIAGVVVLLDEKKSGINQTCYLVPLVLKTFFSFELASIPSVVEFID